MIKKKSYSSYFNKLHPAKDNVQLQLKCQQKMSKNKPIIPRLCRRRQIDFDTTCGNVENTTHPGK